jgi:hypothetical protein
MSKPAKTKSARGTRYTEEIAAEICLRLAEGESLNVICKAPHMPAESTVRSWVIDDREGFAARYTRARDMGLDHHAELILELADKCRMGKKRETGVGPNGPIDKTVTGDMVERARLQIDARKWYLSKLAPKRYGEKLAVEHDATEGASDALGRLLERTMR